MPLKNIPNDAILRIKHIIRNEPVIDIRDIPGGEYFEIREPSPVHEYNGLQMFVGTCVRKVKQKDSTDKIIYPGKVNKQGYVDEHSLHVWTADFKVNKKKWDYRGRLNMLDIDGKSLQCEDPDFLWDDVRKRWLMAVENKTVEKKDGQFKISFFVSVTEDFFGDWQIVPGLDLVPSGNGWYKSAFYSPHFYSLLEMVVDGRNIKGVPNTEAAGYVKLVNGIYVPDPQPTLAIEHLTYLDPKFVTIGIGNLWKINNKPVMQVAGLRDWSYEIWEKAQSNVYNGYWCQMMAISNSPRERWTLINKELVTDKGERTSTIFFYYESEDEWYALDKLPGAKSFCLATIVTENGSKPKPNGGSMGLNLKATALENNKVLLEWDHPADENNVHFQDEFGYFDTKDRMVNGSYEFTNNRNATKFSARPNNVSTWSEFILLDGGGAESPIPLPIDKQKILQHIENAEVELSLAKQELLK